MRLVKPSGSFQMSAATTFDDGFEVPDVRAVSFRVDEERGLHWHEELAGGVHPDEVAAGVNDRTTAVTGQERNVDLELARAGESSFGRKRGRKFSGTCFEAGGNADVNNRRANREPGLRRRPAIEMRRDQ